MYVQKIKALSYLPYFVMIIGVLTHMFMGFSWTETSGHTIGSDDAYISFRYAKNFFEGHGLIFNLDEKVEGYSNLLYTLLITPGFFLGKHNIYYVSVALNCALLFTTLLIYSRFLTKKLGNEHALLGLLIFAFNPWVWANAATGLETILVLTITTALWISVEEYFSEHKKNLRLILILCVISMLSRVDGFVLPVIIAIYAAIKNNKNLFICLVITIFIVMVLHTLFRYFYYQDFIANTFYNKISGSIIYRLKRGKTFIIQNFIRTGLWLPFLICIKLIFDSIKTKKLLSKIEFPILFFLLWSAYLIWIGGDIYYERFLVGLFPLATFILIRQFSLCRKEYVNLILVIMFIIIQNIRTIKDGRFDYTLNRYDGWKSTGEFLGQMYPNATIAVDAAGKIPFYSELRTIDMLGLNDKHIAKMDIASKNFVPGHMKFDANYVLKNSPDIITSWINDNLDLNYGLSKEVYSHQYNLYYLVNLTRNNKYPNNIILVKNLSTGEVQKLIAKGYNYAILKKL
jgi:arabinofuranosyltransferase